MKETVEGQTSKRWINQTADNSLHFHTTPFRHTFPFRRLHCLHSCTSTCREWVGTTHHEPPSCPQWQQRVLTAPRTLLLSTLANRVTYSAVQKSGAIFSLPKNWRHDTDPSKHTLSSPLRTGLPSRTADSDRIFCTKWPFVYSSSSVVLCYSSIIKPAIASFSTPVKHFLLRRTVPYSSLMNVTSECKSLISWFIGLCMAALCNRAGHIFFPRLISAVGEWMSTILPHMVWP